MDRQVRMVDMTSLSTTIVGLGSILILIACSAFFSSSETAIFSLPSDGPRGDGRDDPRSETLRELQSDPHRLLVTILVGNNVVNVAIASITTVIVLERLPTGEAVPVATVLASALVLVFGEIVPKAYGLGHAQR